MAMAMRRCSRSLFTSFNNASEVLAQLITASKTTTISFRGSVRYVQTLIPDSKPLSPEEVHLLSKFFNKSKNLVVLTGAGISTECGIPDYRSPNGAYSTGYTPTIHQEFMRSGCVRRRYWAKHYENWRLFSEAKPGPAHTALATLEKANRISFMITQNIDRLHHRAGSSPLELHGTWAEAIKGLASNSSSDKSFGMKQRPGGGIEIDENFWEENLDIPTCSKCCGVLKPDVVFFGDNLPNDRITKAVEAAIECDAFLVLGTSLTTMIPFHLLRVAHEAGAATAIINIGETEADSFVDLKIEAQVGQILQQLLETSLHVPAT